MTRKCVSVLRVVPLVILLCLLLTGCECKHDWQAADCTTPKTCSKCQATKGEALGHSWADASCTAPKTCSTCNATEGEALAHTWVDATCHAPKTCSVCKATDGNTPGHTWVEATCKVPKTCSVCKATEGELAEHQWVTNTCTISNYCSVCFKDTGNPPGHNWVEATTEAPETCTRCGLTRGYKIFVDPRFITKNCKALFGVWNGTIKLPGNELVGEGFSTTLELDYTISFDKRGNYKQNITISNKDQFTQAVATYYADKLYQEFAAMGYSQSQADEAMIAKYGIDVKT